MNKRIAEAALVRSICERDVFSTINSLRCLIAPLDDCGVEKLETDGQVMDEYLWIQVEAKAQRRDFLGALRYAMTIRQRKQVNRW